MIIGIVGGILQGMEAVYLCRHAGYTSMVIDRDPNAPALSLADRSEVCDVLKETERAKGLFSQCDAVLPALEDLEVLEHLSHIVPECGVPFLFDIDAYRTSCSKERSNTLMSELGVPLPQPWPECGFPIVVKPSSQSGSVGVGVAMDEEQRQKALKVVEKLGDIPVQQEFVSGKSVSIEVIGNGKDAKAYVTTEVVLDRNYDCKQVVCEDGVLPPEEEERFKAIGETVGKAIGLKGLMDVEAIHTKKGLRVLEIDARIPSQTPACICAATGVNLLEELVCSRTGEEPKSVRHKGCAIYEHYLVRGDRMYTCGEKEFAHVEQPCYIEDFWGADEAVTDFRTGKYEWRCTVVFTGETYQDALWKKKQFIRNTMDNCGLEEYIDSEPEMI
ncbi:MAG: 3-methylornithine--L-lysine ligase PylC [archaeon]|nr:3-methylornithine--L-lysine ligase PylC [archaeon]